VTVGKPKSERRQRHALVSVRFTPDELATVQASAAKAAAPVSGYIRSLALQAAPPVAAPLAGSRTPGTRDNCEWQRCGKPGAGELRGHTMGRPRIPGTSRGLPWTLCAEHVKPGHHPADLRDKLVAW
jgi:hypothetical protein